MSSIQVRIDTELYKEIKRFQKRLEFERDKPVSFTMASKIWFKNKKRSDFDLLQF